MAVAPASFISVTFTAEMSDVDGITAETVWVSGVYFGRANLSFDCKSPGYIACSRNGPVVFAIHLEGESKREVRSIPETMVDVSVTSEAPGARVKRVTCRHDGLTESLMAMLTVRFNVSMTDTRVCPSTSNDSMLA